MSKQRVMAVIPCLNEEKHIASVVRKTRQYVDSVLVSDGGSSDDSINVALNAGARVYIGKTSLKQGYGANLIAGIRRAIKLEKFAIIVILDGDGQHDPNDIPDMLRPILTGQADVVMGSRLKQRHKIPKYRLFGNRLLSFACNYRTKTKCHDAVIGFWAIKRSFIPQLTEKKWGVCIEMLIKLRSNGARMVSVPVTPIYHENYADNSTLSPIKLGILLLWAIVKWRIKCKS